MVPALRRCERDPVCLTSMVDLGLSGGTSGSVVVRAIPSEPAVHTPLTVVCVLSELRGQGAYM